ncbi:bifunctional D-glycero-beta-D-manno-heptose-7-phosphate kinase/D-glycero-beta-D-manno-heptose 1-phosphate adenylyltransferase HldE [Gilvimarinus sp. SDUM040013]|uniref:Bifunctional protein HldE n=1 Tax=Gilvimarinus gilvus TaxID=3058038 RepID=A0ABU4RYD2_9GAMM|nr:bifunctional D-glycero-beta-D-manno-heptose-7-phosphate kinase/D-glycero-beta-D-manno-heptose 1-phosphate adenylyltransferase HldE [Gilvimarinus sp. SDUM040013]MDO3387400.1 bifunctional D-glycero-beta-D-manno-heptose-7-phosphate kinase/D-glycero-beta-D-manno-heptose 1-phosphate adenylyltransferase HldE [Gilvimarinus sp. SDUM040013]MDX6849877.1 bifunctional D-glycero-beta-D-manno-heptose-7-phosphate kinase/D-glycero-beta-D-manno-heptose 1-phosphate adenylyltransferase HldE [Gilvimarinus sp. SDU
MQLPSPRYDQSQVLVIGDVMLDRYWVGETSRISPEAPVPVVKVNTTDDRAGGAGNVALNIAALGAAASLVSVVGRDEAAEVLRGQLGAAGILTDFQVSVDKPTITKLRVMSRHQQLIRMDFEQSFGPDDCSKFADKARQLLSGAGVMVLSDYAKGSLANCQALIAAAREQQVPVLVDPKGSDFSRYRGATLLTPNIHELEIVVGACPTEQVLVDKASQLMQELELSALLVTRGEHGMTLLRPNQPELHLPARAREVFDVTGAGDTVIAVLASSLAAGYSLPEATGLANVAAGIVVGKLGTATISGPELRRAVGMERGVERGVVSVDQLLIALEEVRQQGEKVVFTNGCFDIIHAGHVGYLEQAREQGHRLVVAINSDESVSRLKGPSRPINPVERRMAVLAGLEAVDWVISFSDDTPEELLRLIKPDVLVKGGDYSETEVVGWEIVKAYGGEVAVLNFYENCSTTGIIEKIHETS